MHDNINDYKGYKLEVFEEVKEWNEYGPMRIAYMYDAVNLKDGKRTELDFTSYERLTQELWELWIDLGLPPRTVIRHNDGYTVSLPLNKDRLYELRDKKGE